MQRTRVTGLGSNLSNSTQNFSAAITKMQLYKIDWKIVTTSFILVSSSKIAIKTQSLTSNSQEMSLNYVSRPWQV